MHQLLGTEMRLNGKVAIVTGGTSGIGRSIVERFAEQGAKVVFNGRRILLGEKVSKATGAIFVEADVALEADAARTAQMALKVHGRIDVLVNNAGTGCRSTRIENMPLEILDEMMAVHVRGAVAHMKHVSASMRAQRRGSIINIASIGGHRVGFGALPYSAAKAALIHLTRCAALELGEDNVRVNSISPGAIATGIFGKMLGMDCTRAEASVEKVKSTLASFQPIPRAGLPDDVASAAVYLASDESSFINGEDIVVDGGLIRGRRQEEIKTSGRMLRSVLEA
jgi:NAD(P)-dependent dehydrogenase (short-subunit alcohol dehydrogenase family)